MAFDHRKLQPKPKSDNIHDDDCLMVCQGCVIVCNTPKGCAKLCDGEDDLCEGPPCFSVPSPPPFHRAQQSHHGPQTFSMLIISTYVAVGCFLLGGLCFLLFKYYLARKNSRRRNLSTIDETHEDFSDENHGPAVDHPIWLINATGLRQSVIDSIAVCKFRTEDGLVEGTECSVCLGEFEEDESLRLLPKCNHAFHLPCIDTWLRSHQSCPLCRAPIAGSNGGAPASASESSDENFGGMEVRTLRERGSDTEMMVENEDSGDFENEHGRISENSKKFPRDTIDRNCEFRVQSDLAAHSSHVEEEEEEELQPARRSISMDPSSALMIYDAMVGARLLEHERIGETQLIETKNMELETIDKQRMGNSRLYKLMRSSSLGRCLQMGPVSMKRSFSYSGTISLGRKNSVQSSILPL